MTESMTIWLRTKKHPPFDAILNLYGGILYTQDCGRLSFFQLTTIFDILKHADITAKVRFERDLTALHMQYRPYALQYIHSIAKKQASDKKLLKSALLRQSTMNAVPSITKTTFKPQIVSIKLDKSPRKTLMETRKPLQNIQARVVNRPKLVQKKTIMCRKSMKASSETIRKSSCLMTPKKCFNLASRIQRKHIWIYKCLILSYLDCKKQRMPEKFVYDSLYNHHDDIRYDDNKYKVEINVLMPSKVTSAGFDNNKLVAEYNAFYNLFLKLVEKRELDEKLMMELIVSYKYDGDHRSLNVWWFQDNLNKARRQTMRFFYDISYYSDISEEKQAVYCYNINCAFDEEFASFKLSKREKQMLWYHAVSYLFRIKYWMKRSEKDLLIFAMATYFARREFFENVFQFGIEQTLKFMSIKHT